MLIFGQKSCFLESFWNYTTNWYQCRNYQNNSETLVEERCNLWFLVELVCQCCIFEYQKDTVKAQMSIGNQFDAKQKVSNDFRFHEMYILHTNLQDHLVFVIHFVLLLPQLSHPQIHQPKVESFLFSKRISKRGVRKIY